MREAGRVTRPDGEGGYGVEQVAAKVSRWPWPQPSVPYRTFAALVSAGFRRWSTYRQAMFAGLFTNIAFGFLRSEVMLAVAGGAAVAGYAGDQLVGYVWLGQALIATIGIWGDTELATRIRSGEVAADLIRPVHPVVAYLAGDLGRAGFALLTRFVGPVLVGALFFRFHVPSRAATWPLAALSLALAVVLCFACRFLVNATAYWLLDSRGPQMAWTLIASVLCGLYFPLHFLPEPVVLVLWLATPFPSLMQATCDIIVERGSAGLAAGMVVVQAVWVVLALLACVRVQRLAERRMVVQGG
jgi:ABC-2 type transport system permease protein